MDNSITVYEVWYTGCFDAPFMLSVALSYDDAMTDKKVWSSFNLFGDELTIKETKS